jgi:hypothetical protein
MDIKKIFIARNDLINDIDKKDYYKYLFLTGAIWNIVLGIISILSPLFMTGSFTALGIEEPPSLMFYHLFFGVALVYGIGFYLLSTNLDQNHGIVILGVIGKLGCFSHLVTIFL